REAERGGFDLILMDSHMPVLDGVGAARQLRAQAATANIPIIAMTADAVGDARNRYLNAGMDDYVPKPIDPKSFIATVARWTGGAVAVAPPDHGDAAEEDDLMADL